MNQLRTRLLFAPDIPKLEELAVSWDNVVRDIQDYLESQGLHWQRNIGYIAGRELTQEELRAITSEIETISVGCLLYIGIESIGEIHDMTHLFRQTSKDQ